MMPTDSTPHARCELLTFSNICGVQTSIIETTDGRLHKLTYTPVRSKLLSVAMALQREMKDVPATGLKFDMITS